MQTSTQQSNEDESAQQNNSGEVISSTAEEVHKPSDTK